MILFVFLGVILLPLGFMALVYVLDFFFWDSATSVMVGMIYGSPLYWGLLAGGLAYAVIYKLRHPKTFSWIELGTQAVLVFVVSSMGYTQAVLSEHDISDRYVVAGLVEKATYREGYTYKDSNGKRRHVKPSWTVESTEIGDEDISADQYAALRLRCGGQKVISDRHDGQVSDGDGRVFRVDCEGEHIPFASPSLSINFVKASRLSILAANDDAQSLEVADRLRLPDRPEISQTPYGLIGFRRFFDVSDLLDAGAVNGASDQLGLFAAEVGDPWVGRVNPIVVTLSTEMDSDTVWAAVEARWKWLRRFDVAVLVNLDGERHPRWVKAVAETDDTQLPLVEAAILSLPQATAGDIAQAVMMGIAPEGKSLIRFRDPEDYAYLAGSFSPAPLGVALTLAACLLFSWGSVRLMVRINLVDGIGKAFGAFTQNKQPSPVSKSGRSGGTMRWRLVGVLLVVLLEHWLVGWTPFVESNVCPFETMTGAEGMASLIQADAMQFMGMMKACERKSHTGVDGSALWTTVGEYRVGLSANSILTLMFPGLAHVGLAIGGIAILTILTARRSAGR